MKVLLFAPNYLPATRYGGPVRSSHGLSKALVSLGHDVHVFTTNVDGPGVLDVPIGKPKTIDGVKIHYFEITTPKRIYYSPAMKRALEEEVATFDVVHINGTFLWPGPKTARIAKRHGIPVVHSPRGMLVPEMIAGKSALAKKIWIWLEERRALAIAGAIHVTSEEEADGVRQLGLELAPITVVGNGVELPDQPVPPDAVDRIWDRVPAGSRVAFLGRLDWTKGVDLAIDAMRFQRDAQILIAGYDQIGLRAELEPRLLRPDGSAFGRFIGPVDGIDKWAFLTGADLLIAPSVKESFGMSVAEALAVGTPVICTPGVGAAAIISQFDDRCVVPRTRNAISEAIRDLLADTERRSRNSASAKCIMAADYTWTAIAQQMEALYRTLTKGGNRPASQLAAVASVPEDQCSAA